MFVGRRLPARMILGQAAPSVITGLVWSAAVIALYIGAGLSMVRIPFLPIASVGTAVAFYVGFKNNAAYDRFWEARKIWGGVVNMSRSWANAVMSYVYEDASAEREVLIRRHLGWINALRIQLRAQSRYHAWRAQRRERYEWIQTIEKHLRQDFDVEVGRYISPKDLEAIAGDRNRATQILRQQSEQLRELFDAKQLDLFRQLELMKLVEQLYTLHGQCERIKNTPFPRQYAYYARIFTWVFVAILPFGLLDVFGDNINWEGVMAGDVLPAVAMMLSSALVTWVFVTMEVVGDFSEDPFEGSFTDVPMNALCRTIEIDLLQMLGAKDIPEPERPLYDTVLL